jgi:lipoprotein ABC transporter, ATP-binding protein
MYTALRNISLTINDGDFLAIVGESGSGKSTLLHIIGLLDNFTHGKYLLNGKDISRLNDKAIAKIRAKNIGFVKQDFALIDDMTVEDNVMLPLYPIKSPNKRKLALEALDKMGIKKLAEKQVSQLSGGEKQRTAIARAIVTSPNIILADEPTGALDSKTSREIFDILCSLNQNGRTVIIVTHDQEIASMCKKTVEISDGKILVN